MFYAEVKVFRYIIPTQRGPEAGYLLFRVIAVHVRQVCTGAAVVAWTMSLGNMQMESLQTVCERLLMLAEGGTLHLSLQVWLAATLKTTALLLLQLQTESCTVLLSPTD